jgi:hypothetical protein
MPCPDNHSSVSTERQRREGVWRKARKGARGVRCWYLGAVRRSWSGRCGGRRSAAGSPGAPRSSPAPPRLRRRWLPSWSAVGPPLEREAEEWCRRPEKLGRTNMGHVSSWAQLWAFPLCVGLCYAARPVFVRELFDKISFWIAFKNIVLDWMAQADARSSVLVTVSTGIRTYGMIWSLTPWVRQSLSSWCV